MSQKVERSFIIEKFPEVTALMRRFRGLFASYRFKEIQFHPRDEALSSQKLCQCLFRSLSVGIQTHWDEDLQFVYVKPETQPWKCSEKPDQDSVTDNLCHQSSGKLHTSNTALKKKKRQQQVLRLWGKYPVGNVSGTNTWKTILELLIKLSIQLPYY